MCAYIASPTYCRVSGVAVYPGATMLERTPCCASSTAIVRLSPSIPAFDALYATWLPSAP